MHMYVHMYVQTDLHTHTRTHTHTHAHTRTHIHTYQHNHIHTYQHNHRAPKYHAPRKSSKQHISIHTNTHAHTHTHTHTYIQGAQVSCSAEELQAAHQYAQMTLSSLCTSHTTAYSAHVDNLENASLEEFLTPIVAHKKSISESEEGVRGGSVHGAAVGSHAECACESMCRNRDMREQDSVTDLIKTRQDSVTDLINTRRFNVIMADPFYIESCAGTCVCMHICMYICMRTCIKGLDEKSRAAHVYMHVYMYVFIYAYTYMYKETRLKLQSCARIYACIHVCM
jgi:hypothetical protein